MSLASTLKPAPRSQSEPRRGGWWWLLLACWGRAYLVFAASLLSAAMLPLLVGLSGSVVTSGSMEPHVHTGDVVLTRALVPKDPEPRGKVVTFLAPAGSARPGTVLHRVVGKNKDGTYITRGDANPGPDSTPLARADITGQGWLLVPWIGLPKLWATRGALIPLGVWVLATAAAVLVEATARGARGGRDKPGPPPRPGATAAAGPPGPGRAGSRSRPASVSGRVQAMLASCARRAGLLAACAGLALAPFAQSAAAFSAGTTSGANSWSVAGPATRLVFTTAPSAAATGGVVLAVQPAVAVRTAAGATVSVSNAPVTLALTTPAGAALTCAANPAVPAKGLVTFAGCAIDHTGVYTLTATSPGLAPATSSSITISAGPASRLTFSTNPSDSTGGTPFATQPVVTIKDASGNTVTTSTAPVTLTITTPAGATLACAANPTNAVAGVATFAGCSISLKTGTYTLTAASSGLANAVSASFTITAGSAPCSDAVLASSPYLYYKFNETTAAAAVDSSGNGRNGTYLGTGTTTGSPGACVHDTSTAITLNGSTGYISTPTLISTAPNTFTIETWFKTTTTKGGKLIGYGSAKTGLSSQYDRHLYMTNTGRIIFGVYPNAVRTITSPASYNDGSWHLATATLSTEGMKLYLDGQVIATDPATTTGQAYSGYWRIGYDNLNGSWPTRPTSYFLAATIDDAAVYTTALNAVTIAAHYNASR